MCVFHPCCAPLTLTFSHTGFVPYPAYQYYLNEMWMYNITSGFWTEIVYLPDDPAPTGRSDMFMVLTYDNVIFMHGGGVAYVTFIA